MRNYSLPVGTSTAWQTVAAPTPPAQNQRYLLPAALFAAFTLGAVTAPAMAATPIHGELNAVANSEVDGSTAADNDNAGWTGGIFGGLATTVTASAQSGAESVTTHGDAAATWASANEGSVTFTNYGWDFNAPATFDAQSDLRSNRGGADWSYTFTALGDGLFTMNYAVVGAGQLFGLQGWEIGFTGVGAGGPTRDFFDPAASGTLFGQLISGQEYTVTLDGHPNISGGGVYSGEVSGQFDWRITEQIVGSAAPEPSTWALMIAGFGMAGVVARRRRARATGRRARAIATA